MRAYAARWMGVWLALALGGAAPAPAQQPPQYAPWTELLPPTTTSTAEYDSGLNDLCRDDGSIDTYECVERTIEEMDERYERLLEACDHRGLFALAYLRTTEEYRRASLEPGFFEDPEWVNHEDTVFAQLYFDAYDRWAAGDVEAVPRAWRLAFGASTSRSVTTLGDVLLGISAHINRDLPYTLATAALADAETGRSRKPDHDRVNEFLARVPRPLFEEIDAVWDPSFDDQNTLVDTATPAGVTTVQGWRESAWRWAERLVEADNPAERRRVEAGIEDHAYAEGLAIMRATTYPPGQSSAARDAYCAARQRR